MAATRTGGVGTEQVTLSYAITVDWIMKCSSFESWEGRALNTSFTAEIFFLRGKGNVKTYVDYFLVF